MIRLPVQHYPNESAESAIIWVSCSGVDASQYDIPPRAIWFNDVDTYLCTPAVTSFTGITGMASTVTITIPSRGFESASFTRVLTSAGAELATLSAAYFVW